LKSCPYKENRTVLKNCFSFDLGLIGYAEAYALQKRVVAARKAGAIEDVLLLCEHPHVITLGRSGKRENLLAS
jgi:lipoyl(octanoyl) transferase